MPSAFFSALFVYTAIFASVAHGVVNVHVNSRAGSDSNDGLSSGTAVATLQRAVNIVSTSRFSSSGGAVVHVHSGSYASLNATALSITSSNLPNTSSLWPITFTRVSGESRPVVTGGIHLNSSLFRVATSTADAAVWPRIGASARGNLLVTDLAAHGVKQLGSLSRRGFGVTPSDSHAELFCNDQRMTLGRWPNEGFTDPPFDPLSLQNITLTGPTTPDVTGLWVRNGTQDGMPWFYRDGLVGGVQYLMYRYTWVYLDATYTSWFIAGGPSRGYPSSGLPFWFRYTKGIFGSFGPGGTGATGNLLFSDDRDTLYRGFSRIKAPVTSMGFQYWGTRPTGWTSAAALWVKGYWKYLWADMSVPGWVDASNGTIHITQPPSYGIDVDQPWFAFNLLEEIDQPGEYYIDRATGKLYLWPPEAGTESCWISQNNNPLVSLSSVSGIRFNGFIFEYSCASNMATISGGSNNSFSDCTFRHTGIAAASISGTGNGLQTCDVYDVGNRAVSLSGGSRASLTNGENFVADCHIWKFSQTDYTYTPATLVSGCGNIVRHNEFHDSPHTAILFSGNEHRYEYNHIHDVCAFASDAGAIYTGRDWGYRGNLIRFNFIHDIIGFDENSYVQAVYIDDAASGMTVFGNVIYNIHGYATMDSGGRDNLFTNNIIVRANYATQTDCRAMTSNNITGDSWNLLQRLTYDGIHYQQEPWLSRYPLLAVIPSGYATMILGNWRRPEGCVFSCNAMWNNTGIYAEGSWGGTGGFSWYAERANNLNDTDPQFVDVANYNMNLKPTSPVNSMPCWQPIPFNSIGLLTPRGTAEISSSHADGEGSQAISGAIAAGSSMAIIVFLITATVLL